jgi:hypothetical protein
MLLRRAADRSDMLPEQRAVQLAIEDVLDDVLDVLELGSIAHALRLFRVGQKCEKSRDQGDVGESPARSTASVATILLAEWTGSKTGVRRADVTQAGVDTAVVDLGLEFGHAPNVMLCGFPRAHVVRLWTQVPQVAVCIVRHVMFHLPQKLPEGLDVVMPEPGVRGYR